MTGHEERVNARGQLRQGQAGVSIGRSGGIKTTIGHQGLDSHGLQTEIADKELQVYRFGNPARNYYLDIIDNPTYYRA